ncbi:NADH dehydrogenase (ubiquinone) B15 subunit [Andrena cerasifolii]|uniref:NADH dehydrogenase (ubiquinone) B15 subunit n=1 Tax=Andrena cerasifolii TaxID=2819439 RepID=UPI004038349D
MGSNKIESFDVSPKTREIIEWRAARRKELREKYLRQILHPTKQEIVIDTAMQRFGIMRLTHEYQVKLTGKSFLLGFCGTLGFIALCMWVGTGMKDRQEHKYRSGLVRYADREFRFN